MKAVLEVVAVLVLPWMLIMGGFGVLIAQRQQAQVWTGVAAGVLLGPVGWVGLLRLTDSATTERRGGANQPWMEEPRWTTPSDTGGDDGGHRF